MKMRLGGDLIPEPLGLTVNTFPLELPERHPANILPELFTLIVLKNFFIQMSISM